MECGRDDEEPGRAGQQAPDDVREVVIAQVDPADPDEQCQGDPGRQRGTTDAATMHRPEDDGERHVEHERVHRVAAREAVIGQDLRPRELGTWSLDEELHDLVQHEAAAAGDGEEERLAPPSNPRQPERGQDEQWGDDEVRAHECRRVHELIEHGRRQAVQQRRRERIEGKRLLFVDGIGQRAEDHEAGDQREESTHDRERRGAHGCADRSMERAAAGGAGRQASPWRPVAVRSHEGVSADLPASRPQFTR